MLHRYEVLAVTVKVTLPPEQKVVGPDAVMFAVGKDRTVTVVGAEVAEPTPVTVIVTVY